MNNSGDVSSYSEPTRPHHSAEGRPLEQCECGALIEPWLVGADNVTIYQDTSGDIACPGGIEMNLHRPKEGPQA